MSAELLRQAATILRERAEAATAGPWHVDEVGDIGDKSAVLEIARWRGYTNTVNLGEDRPTADYIATMHPSVGLALAKWLDDIAAGWIWDENPEDIVTPDGWPLTLDESMDKHALTLARLIVGDA